LDPTFISPHPLHLLPSFSHTTSSTMSSIVLQLIDSNYLAWERAIHAKLLSAGVWQCIDPGWDAPKALLDSATPEEKRDYKKDDWEWLKAQNKALGLLLGTLDDANCCLVNNQDARTAWGTLKDAHNKQNPQRQFQLFQELAVVHQKPGEKLPAYYSRIEG